MAKKSQPRRLTRKHLARQQRERRQARLVTIGTVSVIVLVVLLIAFGFLSESLIKPRQPIAVVNGEEISTREFQSRVRYTRLNLVNRFRNTLQTMQLFGSDPTTQSFFQDSLSQIAFQLEPNTLGRTIRDQLIEDYLIRQEAARRGITVSEEEVDQALQEFFGYYPGGEPPTPTTTPTIRPTSTLSPLQLSLITPTPTAVISPTEVLSPTTPKEGGTDTEGGTPTATSPAPTATPFTFDAYQQRLKEALDNLNSNINFTEEDLRELIISQLYRDKLFEALTADVPYEQEQVWARHILVDDEATARDILIRLQEGDDFGELAREFSTDTATKNRGGDLGWFPADRMVAEFADVAFNLEIGEISEPVQTQFGFHIIQVLGHEVRPLSPSERDRLRQQEFTTWLTEARANADIQIMDYWAERIPTEPSLPPGALAAAAGQTQPLTTVTPPPATPQP